LQAKVEIDKEEISSIDKGMLLLVGIGMDDTRDIVKKMAAKISKIRIFEDNCGKTNLNIHEVNGKILSVSQFTLLADTK
ncbi:D-aminoacyl-tRNA deacylase, partial [Escherichia coli]|nr:D-aminoacyl-tRNA deacylase [Escherichia coli]